MASSANTVDRIVKILAGAGEIEAKKMFGEYGVYCNGKIVAMVCDDQFFVKRTAEGYAFWGDHEEAPPYPGGKPCMLLNDSDLRNKAKIVELIQLTEKYLPKQKKLRCAK